MPSGNDKRNVAFSSGDRVIDTVDSDDEERSVMRVVSGDEGRANEVKAKGKHVCEYEENKQFPSDDVVVMVVFEDDLDSLVSGWEDMISGGGFRMELAAFESEWSLSVRRYHFPQSRLCSAQ